jgi:hypothetical protein
MKHLYQIYDLNLDGFVLPQGTNQPVCILRFILEREKGILL